MKTVAHEISPQFYARSGGILVLIILATGLYSTSVLLGVVEPNSAAATARNLIAAASHVRIATISEVLILALTIPLAVIFYALLKPAGRYLSLMAAFFIIVGAIIGSLGSTGYLIQVILSNAALSQDRINPQQLQIFVQLMLSMHAHANYVAFILYGIAGTLQGYLIFKSRYLPKSIGIFIFLGGGCDLAIGIGHLLSQAFGVEVFGALFLVPILASLSLALWLIVAGVNREKWLVATGNPPVNV